MSNAAKPLPPQVLEALRAGQPLEAIRLLRESSGWGLKEAMGAIALHGGAVSKAKAPRKPRPSTPHSVEVDSTHDDRKIEASDLYDPRYSPGEVPRSQDGILWGVVAALIALALYFFLRR